MLAGATSPFLRKTSCNPPLPTPHVSERPCEPFIFSFLGKRVTFSVLIVLPSPHTQSSETLLPPSVLRSLPGARVFPSGVRSGERHFFIRLFSLTTMFQQETLPWSPLWLCPPPQKVCRGPFSRVPLLLGFHPSLNVTPVPFSTPSINF